jgi:hypothetical protein
VRFLVYFLFLFLSTSTITFSQSYRFIQREDIRKKVLGRTSTAAMNLCHKKMDDFTSFSIVDTTFEVILVKQTIADSINKLELKKEVLKEKIEDNLRLIERIKRNIFLYPLKKEVYEHEIEELDEQVLRMTKEIEDFAYIKLTLLETKNMQDIDYYKVTFIGDSKNQKGESMFWYTTIFYRPDGQVIIANFNPN